MAKPLPDFANIELFPSFATIPELAHDAPVVEAAAPKWHLLAQVKDNMTINKPTLVLNDRDGSPFALVFEGLDRDGLDLKGLGLKKGATAVISNAIRVRPVKEGQRGFVRVEAGQAGSVKAVPGPLSRVLEVSGQVKGSTCETCGVEGAKGLKSCTGCERVGYCSKVSILDTQEGSSQLTQSARSAKSRDGVKGAIRLTARCSRLSMNASRNIIRPSPYIIDGPVTKQETLQNLLAPNLAHHSLLSIITFGLLPFDHFIHDLRPHRVLCTAHHVIASVVETSMLKY